MNFGIGPKLVNSFYYAFYKIQKLVELIEGAFFFCFFWNN